MFQRFQTWAYGYGALPSPRELRCINVASPKSLILHSLFTIHYALFIILYCWLAAKIVVRTAFFQPA